MKLRKNTLFVAMLAGSLMGAIACGGDDDTTPSSSSGGSAGTHNHGGMGGMTGGTGGGSAHPCQTGCDIVWACSQLQVNGAQLCPGMHDEQAFITGCLDNPACSVIGGVLQSDGTDPTACGADIDTVKGASAEFKAACEGSTGGAGGASAGGAGGSAGAP